jgi:hypothetical protein
MSGPIVELPIRVCPDPTCGSIWLEDANMYEETDRCPRCGRYCDQPIYGPGDEFPYEGGGTSLKNLFLYYQTRGIISFIVKTKGGLNEADYRR